MSVQKVSNHYRTDAIILTFLCIAYAGQFCEEDVDGCTQISCFAGVACTDNRAPLTGVTCGPCPPGLEGNGMKCVGKATRHVFCTPSIIKIFHACHILCRY